MIGVSPAFFFSKYTTHFSVEDYRDGLDLLATSGLTGYQLEIFHADQLEHWCSNGYRISQKACSLGLQATQFVAHFLLPATAHAEALNQDSGLKDMERVLSMLKQFPECSIVTLPLSPFSPSNIECASQEAFASVWDAYKRKLVAFSDMAEASGRHLALEIVPGSLMGGTEGFLRFCMETKNTDIGYNFDTGHAWSSKECIETIPAKLSGRIRGTHLKDNFGTENLALSPGEGSIPWKALLENLLSTGYSGSLDLEIACKRPHEVISTYQRAKEYLESILNDSPQRRNKP